ncbi:MAG TPA: holo-ACP synthase [Mycobacteriales bacterium]|nr:holo-ACP synthase [Mycobacteriales bacterium]
MIIGIGVDIVALERFAESLDRTPQLGDRLFTAIERDAKPESLAATFAAKEAVAKVLGAPDGLEWHDVEVRHDDSGQPHLRVTGSVAAAATERKIARWHLSLSHDAGIAVAMVIAESA